MNKIISIFIGTLCCTLVSCSPWYSDLESVYESAQRGDTNAMYAIVGYSKFENIVPQDTFIYYASVLTNLGYKNAASKLCYLEQENYIKSHQGRTKKEYIKQIDNIKLKWDIKTKSYYSASDIYAKRFMMYRNTQDSVLAVEYRQLAWENWDMEARIECDQKDGIFSALINGVEYGVRSFPKFAQSNVFWAIPNSVMASAHYLSRSLVRILFSSQWWKALLCYAILILLPIIGLVVLYINLDLKSSQTKYGGIGIVLGFWNALLFNEALANGNPNWMANIGALWIPDAAYGLQPYLCVIPMWISVIGMAKIAWILFKSSKNMADIGKELGIGIVVFLSAYTIAGFVGVMSILFIVAAFVIFGIYLYGGGSANLGVQVQPRVCNFCSWYDRANECCSYSSENQGSQARYGTTASSCGHFSRR